MTENMNEDTPTHPMDKYPRTRAAMEWVNEDIREWIIPYSSMMALEDEFLAAQERIRELEAEIEALKMGFAPGDQAATRHSDSLTL